MTTCVAVDGSFACDNKRFNNEYCAQHAFFKKLFMAEKRHIMYCQGCKQIKYWVAMRNFCDVCAKKGMTDISIAKKKPIVSKKVKSKNSTDDEKDDEKNNNSEDDEDDEDEDEDDDDDEDEDDDDDEDEDDDEDDDEDEDEDAKDVKNMNDDNDEDVELTDVEETDVEDNTDIKNINKDYKNYDNVGMEDGAKINSIEVPIVETKKINTEAIKKLIGTKKITADVTNISPVIETDKPIIISNETSIVPIVNTTKKLIKTKIIPINNQTDVSYVI